MGAGVGAATGAVAAAVLGKGTKGAVIGGLIGALVGGAIGHYAYDRQRTRQETVQAYQYKDTHGTVLTIEEAVCTPQSIRPGETVEIRMTYAILNPTADAKTTVGEIREIMREGEQVGRPEVRVDRMDGTYTSTVPTRLPASAKKGLYRVRAMVEAANVKDTKEISFTVL